MASLFDFSHAPDRYAVMGNPVSHSKSPTIHTEFARQTGQNMVYQALQVEPGGLEQAMGNFQANAGKGLNITLPFKEEAWRIIDQCSPLAEQAGAVNTVKFTDDGVRYGDNTDGVGLVRDLVENNGVSIASRRVLVIGAGGAVRGILAPLLEQQPESICICNRTVDKGYALAALFQPYGNIAACAYNSLSGMKFDLVINATSASLHNQLPPLPEDILSEQACCYDLMYADEPTIFCCWARDHGAHQSLDGLGMLVEQAAESFFLWRGVRPRTQPVIAMLRRGEV